MAVSKDNILLGPIVYYLGNKAKNANDELKASSDKIRAKPLVLNDKSGGTDIYLATEQQQKIADLSSVWSEIDGFHN